MFSRLGQKRAVTELTLPPEKRIKLASDVAFEAMTMSEISIGDMVDLYTPYEKAEIIGHGRLSCQPWEKHVVEDFRKRLGRLFDLVDRLDRYTLPEGKFSNEALSELGYGYYEVEALARVSGFRSQPANVRLFDASMKLPTIARYIPQENVNLEEYHQDPGYAPVSEKLLAWSCHLDKLPHGFKLYIANENRRILEENSSFRPRNEIERASTEYCQRISRVISDKLGAPHGLDEDGFEELKRDILEFVEQDGSDFKLSNGRKNAVGRAYPEGVDDYIVDIERELDRLLSQQVTLDVNDPRAKLQRPDEACNLGNAVRSAYSAAVGKMLGDIGRLNSRHDLMEIDRPHSGRAR